MKRLVLFLSLFITLSATAQDKKEEPQFGIKFSGFVKTDIFYDTRQSSASNGIREGHFYLYPDNTLLDAEGKDIKIGRASCRERV